MSPYIFDLIVIVLILLSAGLGFLRGFCNEIFTIFGWIGAVLATIILTPLSRNVLRGHIHNAIIADLTTASIIFIVTMVVFSIISHYATQSLQASKLSAVDRSLGFGFGVLRGILLLGLMFLLVAWMWTPDSRPTCIKEAKTRPILEASAHIVQFILPGDATIDIDGTDETTAAKPDKLKDIMQPKKEDDLKEFQAPSPDADKTKTTPDPDAKPADKPADTPKDEKPAQDWVKPDLSPEKAK